MLPTANQFIDYFLLHIICSSDLHVGYKITAPEKARHYIRKYTCYFLEVALQGNSFKSLLIKAVGQFIIFLLLRWFVRKVVNLLIIVFIILSQKWKILCFTICHKIYVHFLRKNNKWTMIKMYFLYAENPRNASSKLSS